jgi:hypothetical protein
MLGYHYTTLEQYREIRQHGLQPKPIADYYLNRFRNTVDKYLRGGGIWIWRHPLHNLELIGMLVALGSQHQSTRLVGLKLRFDPCMSAYFRYQEQYPDDTLHLTHDLDCPYFGHHAKPFDFLVSTVAPHNIRVFNRYDLRNIIRNKVCN